MPGHDAPFAIGSDLWPGLSKLIEEAGEVCQVAGKIIATGGETAHWDGSDLADRLTEELGDLAAAIQFVVRQCPIDGRAVRDRQADKSATFARWHSEQRPGAGE